MRSIQLQFALFDSHYSSQPKHRKQLETKPKLLSCLSSNEPLRRQQFGYLQCKTKAIHTSSSTTHLVLGLTSPATKSPDISTLIQISAILLVLYVLSNFIVPNLVSKYFRFDKVDKDRKGRDDNDFER